MQFLLLCCQHPTLVVCLILYEFPVFAHPTLHYVYSSKISATSKLCMFSRDLIFFIVVLMTNLTSGQGTTDVPSFIVMLNVHCPLCIAAKKQ